MDYSSLHDLYHRELKDLYSAEKQILRTLPKLAKHARTPELKEAISKHTEETRMHIDRLEDIFERFGKSPRGAKCKGIEGILEEGEDWLDEEALRQVMDAGIIVAMQKVEHYEIAAYGCVRTYANLLHLTEDENLLNATLQEESDTDNTLSLIAKRVNMQARELQAK